MRTDHSRCLVPSAERWGHNIENCYRKNGFPKGWKFGKNKKPVANNVCSENSGVVQPIPGISQDQLTNLIGYLQKVSNASNEKDASYCNFAGNDKLPCSHYCLGAINRSSKRQIYDGWILDNGATDHLTGNTDVFIRIKKSCMIPIILSICPMVGFRRC